MLPEAASSRVLEAYLAGVVSLAEYQRGRQELESKNVSLERKVKELGTQVEHQAKYHSWQYRSRISVAGYRLVLAHASFEQKRRLVELLIDRVLVSNDEN